MLMFAMILGSVWSQAGGRRSMDMGVMTCAVGLARVVSSSKTSMEKMAESKSLTDDDLAKLKQLTNLGGSCDSLVKSHGLNVQKCVDGLLGVVGEANKKIKSNPADKNWSGIWEKVDSLKKMYCFTDEFKSKKPSCYTLIDRLGAEMNKKYKGSTVASENKENVKADLARLTGNDFMVQLFVACS